MSEFEITDTISSSDLAAIEKAVSAYRDGKGVLPGDERDLAILKRDGDGKIIAGLTGKTNWNWLRVTLLWVEPAFQRQGLGTQLLKAAEEEAIKRGCHSAYLYTLSFQSPAFYEKLGYRQFVTMSDLPDGHERLGFMKKLVEPRKEAKA